MAKLLLSIILSLCLQACSSLVTETTPSYNIDIDAISSSHPLAGQKYFIMPENTNIEPSDIQFQEYSEYVSAALNKIDYIQTENPKNSNVIIILSYNSDLSFRKPHDRNEIFENSLQLRAIDSDEFFFHQKLHDVWKLTATLRTSSDDLRYLFPILVAAAKPYISKNTRRVVRVELLENDRSIVEIRNHNKEQERLDN